MSPYSSNKASVCLLVEKQALRSKLKSHPQEVELAARMEIVRISCHPDILQMLEEGVDDIHGPRGQIVINIDAAKGKNVLW